MFAFITGEPLAVALQKKALRKQAQTQWPFLTSLDLSTIYSEIQLISMVKDRTGGSLVEASAAVRGWTQEHAHVVLPERGARETDWESEGGSSAPRGSGRTKGVLTRAK